MAATAGRVFVIHDNGTWVEPLVAALERRGVPYTLWDLSKPQAIAFGTAPPQGVFLNRVSASAHTRGSPHAMDQAATLVRFLEAHGRQVVNGSQALALDMSKSTADVALHLAGIPAPHSVAVLGRAAESVNAALETLKGLCPVGRLVVKPNRGGSGAGVRILASPDAVRAYFASDDFTPSVDGISLIQQYLPSPDNCLYRLEFVNGRMVYAVRVDTSAAVEGATLNNCPADSCDLKQRQQAARKAAEAAVAAAKTGVAVGTACPLKRKSAKFRIVDFDQPALVASLERFVRANGIGVGAVEVVQGADGVFRVIDVNSVNTNYNLRSERRAKRQRLLSSPGGWESVTTLLETCLRRTAGASASVDPVSRPSTPTATSAAVKAAVQAAAQSTAVGETVDIFGAAAAAATAGAGAGAGASAGAGAGASADAGASAGAGAGAGDAASLAVPLFAAATAIAPAVPLPAVAAVSSWAMAALVVGGHRGLE